MDNSQTRPSSFLGNCNGATPGAGEEQNEGSSLPSFCRMEEEQRIGEKVGQNREKGLGLLPLCLPLYRLGSFTIARNSTSTMCSRLRPWAWKNSAMTLSYSSLKPMGSSGKVRTCQCWPSNVRHQPSTDTLAPPGKSPYTPTMFPWRESYTQ